MSASLMRPRVLVDSDGVLSNYVQGHLDVANILAGTSYTHDDVKDWQISLLPGLLEVEDKTYEILGMPGFASSLSIFPGAQKGMKSLAEVAEVFVVTAPLWTKPRPHLHPFHGQTFSFERAKWLEDHFGIDRKHVIFAYHKDLVEGAMLIDDKTSNIQAWIGAQGGKKGTKAVLWAREYNTDGEGCHPKVTRTNDWDEVVRLVKGGRTRSKSTPQVAEVTVSGDLE